MNSFKILFILLIANSLFAQKKVFVVDIKDEIDFSMTRTVTKALAAATEKKADYILVDMNTYGGLLDEADKIKTLLLNYPKPVWVYINDNAASAGALLSLSCDSIYMAPGASIGAATVVNGTDGMALPDKYQSYMRSKMRSVAETNHRDTSLAEAMVDPNVVLDSTIKKRGQVLTLTTHEALKYGFCEKEVNSYSDIFVHNHVTNPQIIRYEPSATDGIFNFLMNEIVTAIIIFIILGAFFMELGSPSGIPSIIIVLLGVLFFLPRYNAGLIQNWEILLMVAGIILLLLEIFVIPGFGVIGILGIVAVFGSLGMMMLNNDYFNFELVSGSMLSTVALTLFLCLLILVGLFFAFSSKVLNNKFFRKVALTETMTTNTKLNHIENSIVSHTHLLQQTGIAHTDLRPSGKIELGGEVYDAVTKGDFIPKGSKVEIVAVFNNSLVVREKQ